MSGCDANATCPRRSNRHIARMNRLAIRLLFPALAVLPPTAPVLAGSSEWAEVEGGSVRVVTEGVPDNDGRLRGALDIRLDPGWKTYWRDPGEAGIPPTVTVLQPAGGAEVEIGYPPPERFDDGYSVWAGYDQPVALALTFDLPEGGNTDRLETSVFLGICEVICIPVQAKLGIDLRETSEAALDHSVVEDAFAALPRPASPEFGAALRGLDRERAVIEVVLPAGSADPELFVASTDDWAFGTPQRAQGDGATAFVVPVLAAPETLATTEPIHYTLIAGDDAVAGTFTIER